MTFSFRSFRNVELGFGDVKLLIRVSVSVFFHFVKFELYTKMGGFLNGATYGAWKSNEAPRGVWGLNLRRRYGVSQKKYHA